jgi:ZIP family zinc transporter
MSNILILSLLAGLATTLGCLLVIALGQPGSSTLAFFLGLAAGVMLAVVIFDLIPTALDYGSLGETVAGFAAGAFLLYLIDRLLSRLSGQGLNGTGSGRFLKMGYLITIGIALHDLPEGMAIAIGYSATTTLGLVIALAIGLHNIPEGMATAAPLRMGGLQSRRIIAINVLISIFTPLGTALGLLLVHIIPHVISSLLALAAGAMAYLVKDELLPESYRQDWLTASLGVVSGFALIYSLTFVH